MNTIQRQLYNFKATKKFNTSCNNFSMITYARLEEHTLKRTMLRLEINNKLYAIMLYLRTNTKKYELGQIRNDRTPTKLMTNLIQNPDAMKSFYIEHNIKEEEFLNFINSLPLTLYNLKAIYTKEFVL